MCRVLNSRRHPHTGVYVGRKRHTTEHFGNPFTHLMGIPNTLHVPTRDDACDAYRDWLAGTRFADIEPDRRQWVLDNLHTLRGRDLVCWCAPLRCHAETLMELANA